MSELHDTPKEVELRTVCPRCEGIGSTKRIGFSSAGDMDSGNEPHEVSEHCYICKGTGRIGLPKDELESQLKAALAANREKDAERDAMKAKLDMADYYLNEQEYRFGNAGTLANLTWIISEKTRLEAENKKLTDRNRWLETGIACAKSDRLGMKEKLDAYNSGGFADADAMAGKYLEEKAIVDRVWKALGISTYEQAGGKAIDEIVVSLRASVGGEKWIDVKQELPEPGVNVLAIICGYSHNSQHYTVYRTEPMGEDGFYTWRDSHYGNQSLWFTHWQPLPAPPTLPTEKES